MSTLWEIVGWTCTVLLVGAYALVATRKLDARSPTYHVLNLLGAIGLAAYSLYKVAWPQFALNLFWGTVALIGIVIAVVVARRLRSGDPQTEPEFDERGVREG
jgi:peptidoglycan/LPS O-acetylase OafA/YrhL